MKKWIAFILSLTFVLTLIGCNNRNMNYIIENETSKWDCTVSCAEKSNAEKYVITYSDEEIFSRTGALSFQNQNDFDIVIHLLTNGQKERTADIAAGGTSVLYEVAKDTKYTVGCHADVDEGTEI